MWGKMVPAHPKEMIGSSPLCGQSLQDSEFEGWGSPVTPISKLTLSALWGFC